MPRLSRLFIRAALIDLALGFTVGALLLVHKGVPLHPFIWRLLPLHIELVLFGWTAQMAMGVAFWILPKFGGGTSRGNPVSHTPWGVRGAPRRRSATRGNERAAWLAVGLLNVGVWLVGLTPLFELPTGVALVGRICEAVASIAFAMHAWPRVKPMAASMQQRM